MFSPAIRAGALLALCMSPAVGHTQPILELTVTGGSATDQRGTRSNATTVAPVLVLRDAPNASLRLFGSGTQFGGAAHSLSAGGATALRSAIGAGVAASVRADAAWTTTSFSARFLTTQLAPALDWQRGAFTISGGARVAHGRTSYRTSAERPIGGGLGGLLGNGASGSGAVRVMQQRSLWGPQSQASAVIVSPNADRAARFTLSYGAWRQLGGPRATAGSTDTARIAPMHDVQVAAAYATGPVTLQAVAGRRLQSGPSDDGASDGAFAGAFASGQLDVALTRTITISAGGGRYLADPITGALGGRFLTAGVSLALGRASSTSRSATAAQRSAPRVRNAAPPANGYTRLVLRAPEATAVSVAGDWSRWQQQPANKAADGLWYLDLALPPGEYRYAFLVNGTQWRVPEHAVTSDDGLGGRVAWISVRNSAH